MSRVDAAVVEEVSAGVVYSDSNVTVTAFKEQEYFRDFHTSAVQLGVIAQRANPKVLVLYHQAFAGKRATDLIAQVLASFKGPVISARDLDVY